MNNFPVLFAMQVPPYLRLCKGFGIYLVIHRQAVLYLPCSIYAELHTSYQGEINSSFLKGSIRQQSESFCKIFRHVTIMRKELTVCLCMSQQNNYICLFCHQFLVLVVRIVLFMATKRSSDFHNIYFASKSLGHVRTSYYRHHTTIRVELTLSFSEASDFPKI